jgi:hypothetical protein
MSFRFTTPGNNGTLRKYINAEYIRHYYGAFTSGDTFQNILNGDDMTMGSLCNCASFRANLIKQGYNDPSQTENQRISQAITATPGGRITFGNLNRPIIVDYLGGREGQPGGSFRPIRNRF